MYAKLSEVEKLLLPEKKLISIKRDFLLILIMLLLSFETACLFSIVILIYTSETVSKGTTRIVPGLVFATCAFGTFVLSAFIGKYLPKLGATNILIIGTFCERIW